MTSDQIAKGLDSLAKSIFAEFPTTEKLVILGIRTRGAVMAQRLRGLLEKKYGKPVAFGILDITFYRDDLSKLGANPMVRGSEINVDLEDAKIILVDDVLYTGRTVRAAIDEINDFGRPALVRLAVMVDRGLREYPIKADYLALSLSTTQQQVVHVKLKETDEVDLVLLEHRP